MPRKTASAQQPVPYVPMPRAPRAATSSAASHEGSTSAESPAGPYRSAVTRIKALAIDPARADEFSALCGRVLAWALDPAHPGRALCFTQDDARRALGVSHYKILAALEVLEEQGSVVRRAYAKAKGAKGWGVLGAVAPQRTLAHLIECVQSAPEPGKDDGAPKPGRRAAEQAAAPLTHLTRKQKEVCLSAARLITEYAPSAYGDMGNVTAEYLARAVDDEGRRVSALETEVAHMSDQRARARAAQGGRPWCRKDNDHARAKVVSGVRTLIRFAIATGWFELADDDEATPQLIETYAPEWHAWIQGQLATLDRQFAGVNSNNHRRGLITLALFATRRGDTDQSSTSWVTVLRDIEYAHRTGTVSHRTMGCVHTVWRRMPMFQALEQIGRPEDRRVSLVPHAAVRRVVDSVDRAASADDLDFGGFVAPDGRAYASLVEGRCGLRRWVWYTAGTGDAIAADETLPAREYEPRYRRRTRRDAIRAATLENRLRVILLMAGWVVQPAADRGACPESLASCDWITTGTALDLAEPAHLRAFKTWRDQQPTQLTTTAGHVDNGDNGWRGLITTMRRYVADVVKLADACPTLPRDEETLTRAVRMDAVVSRMGREAEDVRQEFERCLKINRAWRPDGGRWGLERLLDLRDLLVKDAEEAAGGLAWEEQLRQLREYAAMPEGTPTQREKKRRVLRGMKWRTPTWARAVLCAALIHFIAKLPLRESALRALRLDMIRATNAAGDAVAPWEPGSTVLVDVPGEFTKNGDQYIQAFVARDRAGTPGAERGAARWLLELMWGPGGAHQYFADLAREEVSADIDVSFAFPKAANRGRKGRGHREAPTSLQFAEEGLSGVFRTCAIKHGPALGADVRALRAIRGGLGIHSVRYLAGRFWCVARNLLDYASDLLHHGDIQITKQRYVGSDPGSVSHDILPDDADASYEQ